MLLFGGGIVINMIKPLTCFCVKSDMLLCVWWRDCYQHAQTFDMLSAQLSIAGQALSTDSDEASLSTLEDDDDDDDDDHLAEVMLPDQSKASNSQSHTPLLTPQCMAGTV